MKNYKISKLLNEIADAYEIKGVEWKPRAYRDAARKINMIPESIEEIDKEKLEKMSGIGKGIAEKIREYIKTGRIRKHESLIEEIPSGLIQIVKVPNLGPKKAKKLYDYLEISSMSELKEAAKQKKIRNIPGFGKKTEEEISESLKIFFGGKQRRLLYKALYEAQKLIQKLSNIKEVEKVQLAGSLRRMKETIGDVDILLIAQKKEKVLQSFANFSEISSTVERGRKKASFVTYSEIRVDLRFISRESWGSALLYFTGSKEHGIALRKIANKQGYKLSEYGLFYGNKKLASKTEKEIYAKLGLSYIEPELRENNGEIEVAKKNKLPKLLELDDIKGDLHVHSDWSDGENSVEDIVKKAIKLKYEYICISDHSLSRKIMGGLKAAELKRQKKELEKINKKFNKIRILKGSEVDILRDGSLDFRDEELKKLDFVIASIHSGFRMDKKKMTDRILKAMENKYISAIGHPVGRKLNKRLGYDIDLEKVIIKASEKNIALEVNSFPDRLDLNQKNIRFALEKGVKVVINTDSHNKNHLNNMWLGVSQARRAWAEKKDVINTYSYKKLKKCLK